RPARRPLWLAADVCLGAGDLRCVVLDGRPRARVLDAGSVPDRTGNRLSGYPEPRYGHDHPHDPRVPAWGSAWIDQCQRWRGAGIWTDHRRLADGFRLVAAALPREFRTGVRHS